MKDVQNLRDHRKIDIKKVGIKGISYPIHVLDQANKTQATVASINMYVHLPHEFKGTHMSRFVEILNTYCGDLNLKAFFEMLEAMKEGNFASQNEMEKRITEELNSTKVGALGLGGDTSVLATFIRVGPLRASGVRIVSLRVGCCFDPRRATVSLG